MWPCGVDPASSNAHGAPGRSVQAQRDNDPVIVCGFRCHPSISAAQCPVLLILMGLILWVVVYWGLDTAMPTVHMASLSFATTTMTPSPSVSPSSSDDDGFATISGNWSVSFTAKNQHCRERLTWDHARVMLFCGAEFIAGTFLNRVSSVPPRHHFTLESGVVAFSREIRVSTALKLMELKMNGGGGDDGLAGCKVVLRTERKKHSYYCHALRSGSPCN